MIISPSTSFPAAALKEFPPYSNSSNQPWVRSSWTQGNFAQVGSGGAKKKEKRREKFLHHSQYSVCIKQGVVRSSLILNSLWQSIILIEVITKTRCVTNFGESGGHSQCKFQAQIVGNCSATSLHGPNSKCNPGICAWHTSFCQIQPNPPKKSLCPKTRGSSKVCIPYEMMSLARQWEDRGGWLLLVRQVVFHARSHDYI